MKKLSDMLGPLAIIICFSIAIVAGIQLTYITTFYSKRANTLEKHLSMKDYIVIEGRIESPSIIIDLGSYSEFIDIAVELQQDTIYRCGQTFYVFNDGLTIAYSYFGGYFKGDV